MSSNMQIEKVCEYCRKIFISKTTKTRYCDLKCNSRAYMAIQREAKLQVSSLTMKKEAHEFDASVTKKDFLSIDEAAKLIGVSRRKFYRIINRDEITIKKLGRRTIVRRSDVDTYFKFPDITIPDSKLPDLNDCYTVNEMHERFDISNGALYNLIRSEQIRRFVKVEIIAAKLDEK